LLLFFFLSTLTWYSLKITGLWFLIDFFRRGLTVGLGDSERDYFLHNWPWYYVDLARNSGKELYVGDQYIEGIILVFILFIVLSIAFSLSTLNTLSLVRQCGAKRLRFLSNLLRMLAAICVAILIDLSFAAVFLAMLVIGGRSINVSLDEVFKASASEQWLEYGYEIAVGNAQIGKSNVGLGIITQNIDFEELHRASKSGPEWIHWVFPDPQFEYDAGSLCRRYELESVECADRLRSLYFRHLPSSNESLGVLTQIAHHLYSFAVSIACGNDTWSPLATGSGEREGIALGLPWAAALAMTILSRFLIIPWLVLVLVADQLLVRMGKRAALSSEKGLTFLVQHGRVLLLSSPFIAISIVWVFTQRLC
jgi:hypothetical protein